MLYMALYVSMGSIQGHIDNVDILTFIIYDVNYSDCLMCVSANMEMFFTDNFLFILSQLLIRTDYNTALII